MIRKLAYETLERIGDDKAYSQIALNNVLEQSELQPRDRGLVTSIVYGCLTWQRSLDLIISQSSKRIIPDIERSILRVLRIGVYQLRFLDRVPDHAAINESVNIAKILSPDSAGFVNAVLRNVAKHKDRDWWRETDKIKKPVRYLGEKYSLPNWLVNRLIQPLKFEEAERVAKSFVEIAATYVRLRKENYEVGVAVEHYPHARKIVGVTDEIREGLSRHDLVVQDLGAQIITLMCGDVDGKDVLDSCAGMGGKSIYLHDLGAKVVAVEPHQKRLAKLSQTLPEVETFVGELETFVKNKRTFDVVLIDAPCSALGVLRRHPETKWSRKESDINRLEQVQSDLLDAGIKALRPDGILVYAVCTFSREETTKQVEKFLLRHPEFCLKEMRQLWPHIDDCDAFFMASLERK